MAIIHVVFDISYFLHLRNRYFGARSQTARRNANFPLACSGRRFSAQAPRAAIAWPYLVHLAVMRPVNLGASIGRQVNVLLSCKFLGFSSLKLRLAPVTTSACGSSRGHLRATHAILDLACPWNWLGGPRVAEAIYR